MYHVSSWRQKALDHIYEHVCADDSFTKGISIGPVSFGPLHTFSAQHNVMCCLPTQHNFVMKPNVLNSNLRCLHADDFAPNNCGTSIHSVVIFSQKSVWVSFDVEILVRSFVSVMKFSFLCSDFKSHPDAGAISQRWSQSPSVQGAPGKGAGLLVVRPTNFSALFASGNFEKMQIWPQKVCRHRHALCEGVACQWGGG